MIPSVRNSESQHRSVFEAAQCIRAFYTPEFVSTIDKLKLVTPDLQSFVVLELDELIDVPSQHYAYNRTWNDARTDPILIAHSSGSTGKP